MGKIYEAQKRADKEHQKKQKKSVYVYKPKTSIQTVTKKPALATAESQDSLRANLQIRTADSRIKTIMFTGISQSSGVSSTAISFATSLAAESSNKVLLIDANLRNPYLHEVFNIAPYSLGLTDLLDNTNDTEACIKYIKVAAPSNLFVLVSGQKTLRPAMFFESRKFDRFLNTIRMQFDCIILDVPPAPIFSESRIICSKVDGVVLVIVSGKTRRQVALRAKLELERAGANLMGIVLNRRKYPIPEWIYKRL